MNIKITKGDCLKELKKINSKSVNLILIDPPYKFFKTKKRNKISEYILNIFIECERILKDDGSLYFFNNNFEIMSEFQYLIKNNTNFNFKSLITIYNPNHRTYIWKNPTNKNKLKSWFNVCEYCLFYTLRDENYYNKFYKDINKFKDLRNYFKNILSYINKNKKRIIKEIGGNADHCFRYNTNQWILPSEDTYNKLIKEYKLNKYENFLTYDELLNIYKKEKEKYDYNLYTHNLYQNHNNVWISDDTLNNNKSLNILKKIILTSSNKNDCVLDCFMGKGKSRIICIENERNYIGIKNKKNNFKKGVI